MTKVQKIEQDVRSLTSRELAEFRDWFMQFDAAVWDAQVARDAEAGKLDSVAREALEEYERQA